MSFASRAAARSARIVRAPIRANARQGRRFASTDAKAAQAGGSAGFAGGLAGGGVVFILGYGYYRYSGAKQVIDTATTTKKEFEKLGKSLKDKAPEPNEALSWLRNTALSYAAFIPGAKSYVEAVFNDLDKVQQKHGDEVEKIVNQAYQELKDVANKGMNWNTAQKTWEILDKYIAELGELAKDSASEIIDNHPQLKEKVGPSIEQLKTMADSYGPEAKKELDKTYAQIKDVISGGVGIGSIAKIKQLIDEKLQKMKSLGDEAWKKGLEQAKPYLDKNPKLKEILEQNADSLKQGNFGELFEKVKDAATSGNTNSLEQYVQEASKKAKETGFLSGGGSGKGGDGGSGGIESYAKMIPGMDKILPEIQKLSEVAQEHGGDAEKILKGTYEDIANVLKKRTAEAEKLADKATQDGKKKSGL